MSSNLTNGQNITTAVNILLKTYENLDLLFKEMDRIGEAEGYVPIGPKFLRWKSDVDTNGWLTKNFIKLYQKAIISTEEGGAILANEKIPNLGIGDIFGIEVNLDDWDRPMIGLIRYTYDYTYWERMPSIADHWLYYYPFNDESQFKMREEGEHWFTEPNERSRKKYWGLQHAVSRYVDLVEVHSPDTVRNVIFDGLSQLPEYRTI